MGEHHCTSTVKALESALPTHRVTHSRRASVVRIELFGWHHAAPLAAFLHETITWRRVEERATRCGARRRPAALGAPHRAAAERRDPGEIQRKAA